MKAFRLLLWSLEYLALRLVDLLYRLIPARCAYNLGAGAASFAYPLFRERRRIAVKNILRARITTDPVEADRIARRAFGHLAGHLLEALKVGQVVTAENWRKHIVFDGPAESFELLLERPDVPIMILSGHHGVWEAAVTIISFTRPMIAVARKMNNPFVERFLKRRHFRGAITIVPKKMGFAPSVLRQWKETCAAMTLVMDQHAGKKQGMTVDFMGRPASTHTSPARLHLKTGAPILAGAFIRDGAFRYRMVTGTPIRFSPTGNKERDTAELLTLINQRLEDVIRRYPEQYLWAHKRWR
ncbi:MAG TPA: lysophospholipid acyltransferase family protein [Kiritimatiellia bacterium]|nr:lysophospholipid acyltransferase family protein [Kiritimatiellia bacterium]HRU70134.1 lysophospholipid acyltransferase family protein [Kiritimatiellia bacterium]